MTSPRPRKPDWLKVRFPAGPGFARIDRMHREQGLHSVCRSAACPNQGECWSQGTATFMILGDRCSRDCAFCNVAHGPAAPPDPGGAAGGRQRRWRELGLRHAVITAVTRDDLADGGAAHFAAVTAAIRAAAPGCRVELLIPDLGGDRAALRTDPRRLAPTSSGTTSKPCRASTRRPAPAPTTAAPSPCSPPSGSWRPASPPRAG